MSTTDKISADPISRNFLKVGKNSIIYILGDILSKGISFLLIPLYTTLLSPAEYGSWGILLAIISLLNIILPLQMGASITVNYFQVKQSDEKKFITTIWVIILISSTLLSAILIGIKQKILPLFQGITEQDFILGICIAFSSTFSIVPQTLMRLRYQAINLVIINTIIYLSGIILGILFLITKNSGITNLLMGMFLANLISIAIYIWIMRNDLTPYFSTEIAKNSFLIALPILPHMLSHWGLNLIDRFILQAYIDMNNVGIYQLGYQLGTIMQLIVIAINNAWAPFFMENLKAEGFWKRLKTIAKGIVFIEVWLSLILAIFLPIILKFITNEKYQSAALVIPWIVLGFVFVGLYQFGVNLLLFYKKTYYIPVATGVSVVTNIVINILFIPRYGFYAAAINTTIAYLMLFGLIWLITRGISKFKFEYPNFLKLVVIALLLFLSTYKIPTTSLSKILFINSGIILIFPIMSYLSGFWNIDDVRFFHSFIKKKE